MDHDDADDLEDEDWSEESDIIPGLDPKAVAEGKKLELDFCEAWDIFEPVLLESHMTLEDCKWILRVETDYSVRARLVARQYRWKSKREDLFAPSSTNNTSRVIDLIAVKKGYCTCTADATRAFFQVPQEELCYVQPPMEWIQRWMEKGGDASTVWRMKRWLYGQRKAPVAWIDWEAEVLESEGCVRDPAAPHFYRNAELDATFEVHADDIHGCGSKEALMQLRARLSARIVFKHFDIHEVGAKYEHLRRTRERTPSGMWIKSNDKHLDKALALMGMEGCNSVPTPMVQEAEAEEDLGEALQSEAAARYRSAVCTLLYASQDRVDCQYAIKELSRELSTPTVKSEQRLKRVLRYMQGTRGYANFFPGSGDKSAVAWSDTNWAACKRTRKSTSAGLLIVGGCCLYSWSRTQSVIATSSGEAEWYGIASATAESLFMQGLLERLHFPVRFEVRTDSSAARAIGLRVGSGKIRSLAVKTLWCQHVFKSQAMTLAKCRGHSNPADLGTKAYSNSASRSVMHLTGLKDKKA
eukprot:5526369-Amphidinium_carterae.1